MKTPSEIAREAAERIDGADEWTIQDKAEEILEAITGAVAAEKQMTLAERLLADRLAEVLGDNQHTCPEEHTNAYCVGCGVCEGHKHEPDCEIEATLAAYNQARGIKPEVRA